MVSFKFRITFVAVTLAGIVAAMHIKRHRFLSHRNQCRPRLASTFQSTSPSSIFPSVPEPSSSVSIPAQMSHASALAQTTIFQTSTTRVTTALSTSLTPNDVKAGIAGGDAYPFLKDHIGWWYDWSVSVPFFPFAKLLTRYYRSPDPSKPGKPIAVPMLWGNGTVDAQDKQRLIAFEDLSTVPTYVLGYEEPDCDSGSGSADMTVHDGVSKWESLIAPLGKRGSKLGSPSMCSTLVAVSHPYLLIVHISSHRTSR